MRCSMVFAVAAVLMLVLPGCPPTPGLVGTWKVTFTDGYVEFWTFYADETFYWESRDGDTWGEGEYTRADDTVTTTESWDDAEGSHEVVTVIDLSPDELSFSGEITAMLDGVLEDTWDIVGQKR